jgi:hypothetical protein
MKRLIPLVALVSACSASSPDPLKGDEATAKEAIAQFVSRGEAAIPELKARIKDEDPVARKRVKTALARITGQWGWDGGVVWERDFAKALAKGKPVMVLQLFGKLDEEFC